MNTKPIPGGELVESLANASNVGNQIGVGVRFNGGKGKGRGRNTNFHCSDCSKDKYTHDRCQDLHPCDLVRTRLQIRLWLLKLLIRSLLQIFKIL